MFTIEIHNCTYLSRRLVFPEENNKKLLLNVRCYSIVFTKLYNNNVANVNFDVNFIYLIFHDFNIYREIRY